MSIIAIFSPSIYTNNVGDEIIVDSVKRELTPITKGNFVITVPTHTPVYRWYEIILDKLLKKNYNRITTSKYNFIAGSNLLTGDMIHFKNSWNIDFFDAFFMKNCILVGVGHNQSSKKVNAYTKWLYKRVLSKDVYHSVRDESTKKLLESIGFKAINTGCCTLWGLNSEHCKKIPTNKSDSVLFTLTDYGRDEEKDQKIIDILLEEYEEVNFWPQGIDDLDYIRSLNNIEKVNLLNPDLKEYDEFLRENDCDFVGTRLHGGVRALQHFKRTIFIAIDNRTRNMGRDYNLTFIERDNIEELPEIINDTFITDVTIDHSVINQWMQQF